MVKGASPCESRLHWHFSPAMAPGSASAFPLALADHAAMSREVGGSAVEKVHHKTVHARHYPRYASASPRRYYWTYYPYWRPYQYYYWQHYYPYGGPLF
jgi:hypothetical protein